MKINVWIRPGKFGRGVTLRLETKFENYDTPTVAAFGKRLADAIEGTTTRREVKESAECSID